MAKTTIFGLDKVLANLSSYSNSMKADSLEATRVVADKIKNDAIKSIEAKDKSGKTYTKKGGRKHVASAKGEPPASDTGTLARSIVVERSGFGYEVKAGAEYAAELELNKDRPFLFPALEKNKKEVEKEIVESHKKNSRRLKG